MKCFLIPDLSVPALMATNNRLFRPWCRLQISFWRDIPEEKPKMAIKYSVQVCTGKRAHLNPALLNNLNGFLTHHSNFLEWFGCPLGPTLWLESFQGLGRHRLVVRCVWRDCPKFVNLLIKVAMPNFVGRVRISLEGSQPILFKLLHIQRKREFNSVVWNVDWTLNRFLVINVKRTVLHGRIWWPENQKVLKTWKDTNKRGWLTFLELIGVRVWLVGSGYCCIGRVCPLPSLHTSWIVHSSSQVIVWFLETRFFVRSVRKQRPIQVTNVSEPPWTTRSLDPNDWFQEWTRKVVKPWKYDLNLLRILLTIPIEAVVGLQCHLSLDKSLDLFPTISPLRCTHVFTWDDNVVVHPAS